MDEEEHGIRLFRQGRVSGASPTPELDLHQHKHLARVSGFFI